MVKTEPTTTPNRKLTVRQRRRLSLTIQYLAFIAAVGIVAWIADWATIADSFFDLSVASGMFPDAYRALANTVTYTVLAYAVGSLIGVPLALMRISANFVYRWFAMIYIEIFRGLPALLVLFLVGFGLPMAFPGLSLPGGVYGTVALALGLTSSAYIAETVRAGIQAVPSGQVEAARSLGMSHSRTMTTVVLPQAIRIVIPPLTNEFVMLTKDSSLVFAIGLTAATMEITRLADSTLNAEANATPLVVGGLLYLMLTVPLGYVARLLENKGGRS
ncbi:amino acid ABC transporter permease [Natronoglycomyces albus]|uniref:Amino acid ABC transporter permease n=1 Tax=Natronoglycomyces albus TaxID=2811108 RepID=A0A895XN32_9ACTN|nr:amino acid ABC transporter permease [Natronoglycomyces albus]QSB06764.1 amino acid ABC transporter permease [Natronoglycomyces albus]